MTFLRSYGSRSIEVWADCILSSGNSNFATRGVLSCFMGSLDCTEPLPLCKLDRYFGHLASRAIGFVKSFCVTHDVEIVEKVSHQKPPQRGLVKLNFDGGISCSKVGVHYEKPPWRCSSGG